MRKLPSNANTPAKGQRGHDDNVGSVELSVQAKGLLGELHADPKILPDVATQCVVVFIFRLATPLSKATNRAKERKEG